MPSKHDYTLDIKMFRKRFLTISRCGSTFTIALFGLEVLSIRHEKLDKTEAAEKTKAGSETADVVAIPEEDVEPTFVCNSLFLKDCFHYLTKTEDEGLHLVTGCAFDNLRSLERIVPLNLSEQSVGGANAENASLVDALIQIHDHGLLPLAYFHSHPGYGASATNPSHIDRQTQGTMERGGSKVIGGVFSRDGFIRFYANRTEPSIRVVGKRVREVSRNVYKLEIEESI